MTATPRPGTTPTPSPSPLAVTIIESRYGSVTAITSGGAVCSATARLPNGTVLDLGTKTVPPAGLVNFSYAQSPTAPGTNGEHTVTCTLGARRGSAKAAFTVLPQP